MKRPIRSLEVTYHLHATEDPDKVASAVAAALTDGAVSQLEHMEGHYGNTITSVRIHLVGEEAWKAFEGILARLTPDQKDQLASNLDGHVDEHSALYLRFDKQRLVDGSLVLGSSDPIRVKVKPSPFLHGQDAAAFYAKQLGREE